MEEFYSFDDATYERLAASTVTPFAVMTVLYGRHRIRRHFGSVLQVAGFDPDGRWLGVFMVETGDDSYLVVGARYLDDREIKNIRRMEGP